MDRFERITAILAEVVDLAPSVRSEYLDRSCQGDPDLRAEIEDLLSVESNIPDILGTRGAAVVLNDNDDLLLGALRPGQNLGPYKIEAIVGSGGMGEVYRAHDQRLGRRVALKVLSPLLTHNPDFKRRFEREARAVSKLAHPRICTLHDIGSEDGIDFLVMEYIEGRTLADALKNGPLPLKDVLRIGIEITEGLDAAHRAGIVHRDLKPGNVMLARGGIKLVDFGVAKLGSLQAGGRNLGGQLPSTDPASGIDPLTGRTDLIGTMPYMAPEQLDGQPPDTRSDVFALGALLFEMVTGRRAFEGSGATLIANIMTSDPPPIRTLVGPPPPALEKLIRACLEKDPGDRMQTAHGVKLQLQWTRDALEDGTSDWSGADPRSQTLSRRWFLPILVVGVLLLVAVLEGSLLRPLFGGPAPPRTNGPAAVTRFTVHPPEGSRSIGRPRLSPDGSQLAFIAEDSTGRSSIWIRPLRYANARRLPGTKDVDGLFWSPDSRRLGFYSRDMIRTIDVASGILHNVCSLPEGRVGGWPGEAAWSKDGRIIFDIGMLLPLYEVAVEGGQPKALTTIDAASSDHGHMRPSLNGGYLFYLKHQGRSRRTLYMEGPGQEPVRLGRTQSRGLLSSGNHLLSFQGRSLMAMTFDPKRPGAIGEPIPIAESLISTVVGADFSISDNGILAYRASAVDGLELTWVDRKGRPTETVATPGQYRFPSLSPDGSHLAVARQDKAGNRDIWIHDLLGGEATRLTFQSGNDNVPIWSPDGQFIAYLSTTAEYSAILRKNIHMSMEAETLIVSPNSLLPQSLSPDGRGLLYTDFHPQTGSELMYLPLRAGSQPRNVLASGVAAESSAISPDGQWIAYRSDDSGKLEIFVERYPAGGLRRQISAGEGGRPLWRADSGEIFFATQNGEIMSITVDPEADAPFGRPERLFSLQLPDRAGEQQFAASPDGERFLFLQEPQSRALAPITVVINWESELVNVDP